MKTVPSIGQKASTFMKTNPIVTGIAILAAAVGIGFAIKAKSGEPTTT